MSAEELSEEDIRQIVREEMESSGQPVTTSRRNALKALGVAGAGAALGGGSTAALTQRASAATDAGDIGTPTDRYDLYARLVDTEQLSSAPIVFSSKFNTFQGAVDAAGGGVVVIDDTKREEGIGLAAANSGLTVVGKGGTVQKPSVPTNGEATWRVKDGESTEIADITFRDVVVENPDLGDVDIDNEDTRAGPDRRSAWEPVPPASSNVTASLTNWTWENCRASHVQGYGFGFHTVDQANLSGCVAEYTCYDGYYQATSGMVGSVIGCKSLWSGRHNFTAAGAADEDDFQILGCYGEDAYTAGIDIEDGQNISLNARIRNPSRSGGTGNIDSGIQVSSPSISVGGRVVVHDPNNRGATLSGPSLDDFSVTVYQSAVQNPNDTREIRVNDASGTGTFSVFGGGGTTGAIFLLNNNDNRILNADIHVEDAYAHSLEIYRSDKNNIRVTSVDPNQSAALDVPHVKIHGISSENALDNVINLTAVDNGGNAAYGVLGGGNSDYSRISGNVRGAYSSAATSGLGVNSDTTDLIT